MAIALRYAARSDLGLLRGGNEDSAADGGGGKSGAVEARTSSLHA